MHASRATLAASLMEEGVLGLDQIDLWYFDAILAVRTERTRLLREQRKR